MSTTLVQADERHYTPKEIAELWNFDENTIRAIFRDEQGVLRWGTKESTARKRAYSCLRIPASVMQRVHRRLQVKD